MPRVELDDFEEVTVTVRQCARCGGAHRLPFRRFHSPQKDYTHWAPCPATGQPVLLTMWVEVELRDPRLAEPKWKRRGRDATR